MWLKIQLVFLYILFSILRWAFCNDSKVKARSPKPQDVCGALRVKTFGVSLHRAQEVTNLSVGRHNMTSSKVIAKICLSVLILHNLDHFFILLYAKEWAFIMCVSISSIRCFWLQYSTSASGTKKGHKMSFDETLDKTSYVEFSAPPQLQLSSVWRHADTNDHEVSRSTLNCLTNTYLNCRIFRSWSIAWDLLIRLGCVSCSCKLIPQRCLL